jgi:putative effector of murein hydrolase LrgA (UPF0299 family)
VTAGVVAVVLGALSVGFHLRFVRATNIARNEFTEDYVSARAVGDGLDPYEDTQALVTRYLPDGVSYERAPVVLRNPHTPSQISLARPLSAFPYRSARTVWFFVMTAMIATAGVLVARALGASRMMAGVCAVGVLALPIVQAEIVYGNVTGLILLLMVLGWRDVSAGHRRRGGALLGVAAALKIFPVFLIIPLIRRRLHAAWAAFAASAVVAFAAGFLATGTSIASYRHAATSNFAFWRASPKNVSLVAIPFRWLTRSIWRPDASVAPAAAWSLAGVLVLGCVLAAWRTRASRSRDRFWAVAPWMILASPLAWDRYVVLALPFLATAASAAVRDRVVPPVGVLAAAAVAVIGTFPGAPVASSSVGLLVFVYGLPTYALAALAFDDLRVRSSGA